MPLEPEHGYLIPPGAYLSMQGSALRLSEPRERHGARLPFDFFLRSLAEELGRRAFLMELDPLYCDVITNRFEQVTGKKCERRAA